MRILIIKMSSLGDLFHALPTVHALKMAYDADIDWVAYNEYQELIRCFTDVSRFIPFPRRTFPRDLNPFLSELRLYQYDIIIDLQGLLKSAITARLARGRKRIGPSFHREGSRLFYSAIAGKRDKNRHAVEENLDIINYLGLPKVEPAFPVEFPEINLTEKRPRIAILPSSRWQTKNWPVENFISLCQQLKKERDASLFLIGGHDDIALCDKIAASVGSGIVNMAGKHTLINTGSLLKEMDLLIANDSGPVHMAAATGTPVLALFGPTDPRRTGPYGSQHRIIQIPVSCSPCFSRSCKLTDVSCMSDITPEMVKQAAIEILDTV